MGKSQSLLAKGIVCIAAILLAGIFALTISARAEEAEDITQPFEGYTRYEAEDAVLTNAKKYTSGTAFSGTGYIGEIDIPNVSKAVFTVTAEQEGEYDIQLAYAIGKTFSAASMRLYNADGYYMTLRCNTVHDWGDFQRDAVAYGKISLREGENEITVYKGANYAQIDFIGIGARTGDYIIKGEETEDVVPLPEGYVRYEAERATVVNASAKGRAFNNDYGEGYSGGGFVGNIDDETCYINFDVTVTESGTYPVRVRYASGSSHVPTLKLYVGKYGKDGYLYFYQSVSCAVRNGWGAFSDEGVVEGFVGLQEGTQYIRVTKGDENAELDCIELGGKTGEYVRGTDESAVSGGGNNEFDDDMFGEAEVTDDGYAVIERGCGSFAEFGCGGAALLCVAVSGVIMIGRRKHEKG